MKSGIHENRSYVLISHYYITDDRIFSYYHLGVTSAS